MGVASSHYHAHRTADRTAVLVVVSVGIG